MKATTAGGWNLPRLLTGELGLALAALALFIAFIFGLLRMVFPQGTDIDAADQSTGAMATTDRPAALGFTSAGSAGERLRIGALSSRHNDVQSRSARELEWHSARIGTEIYAQDALQTGPRSYAAVRARDGTQLSLGERSLIVFEGAVAGLGADYARPVAVIMQGELSGQTAAGSVQGNDVVRVNGGALRVAANDDTAAEYTVRVNENQSATISVLSGRAEFAGTTGTTTIGTRQALTVDERGTRVALSALPNAPSLTMPGAGTRIVSRNANGRVDFAWTAVPDADGYRFVIARDRALSDRIVDERTSTVRMQRAGLAAGRYFWTARSRAGWTESAPGEVRELLLVSDAQPPVLSLDATPRLVSVRSVTISGRTDPDARIFVAGKPAQNAQGSFRYVTELAAGANVIVVESVDAVGNVSYASVVVVAK